MMEETDLPDIPSGTEDSGFPEERDRTDPADSETSVPEDASDGAFPGDDETEQEDGGTDGNEADTDASGDNVETDGDGTEADDTETEDGTETDGTEAGDGTETDDTETPESLNVSGNILILPEGYEFDPETFGLSGETEPDAETGLSPEQFTQLSEHLELLEEYISIQTDVFYGGTAVVSLILGAVLGILLLHGFRMRRV